MFVVGDKVNASAKSTRKMKDRLRHGGEIKKLLARMNMSEPKNGLVEGKPAALVSAGSWLGWVGLEQLEKVLAE